jgi:hypothetical protein
VVLEKVGEDHLEGSCENKEYYTESKRRGISYMQYIEARLTALITSLVETAF